MIGNSDNKTNFPRNLLITNRQVSNIRKAFGNYLSTDPNCQKLNYLR